MYYARFGIGAAVGLMLAIALAPFFDAWWLVAIFAAVIGMIAFLASFFIWNPDRVPSEDEPEGYEQVLFDTRNVIHLAVIAVVMTAGAFGSSVFWSEPSLAPEVQQALDDIDAQASIVREAAQAVNANKNADEATLQAIKDTANAAYLALNNVAVPDGDVPLEGMHAHLVDAASLVEAAAAGYICQGKGGDSCPDALGFYLDAYDELEAFTKARASYA